MGCLTFKLEIHAHLNLLDSVHFEKKINNYPTIASHKNLFES